MNALTRKLSSSAPLLLAAAAACVFVCAHASRAQDSAQASHVRLVAELKGYEGPSGFNGRPALAVFSPDGRTFALSGEGRTVRLYEAETGRLLFALAGDKDGSNGFSFAPGSATGATRNLPDRSVSVWDLTTGKLVVKLSGRAGGFETKLKGTMTLTTEFDPVAFSPDGRVVLTEREDDVVAAWDSSKGRQLFTLEHKTESNAAKDVLGFGFGKLLLMSAAFSHDGSRIVTANGDKSPKLWDASTGRLVATLSGPEGRTYDVRFLKAAGAVLTISLKGEVTLWDASTGARRAALTTGVDNKRMTSVTRDGGPVAVSADGRLVAAQVRDETLIWDASDGRRLAVAGRSVANMLALSPDGRTLAAAGVDKRSTARLFDAETGRLKLTLGKAGEDLRSMLFSPDGRLLLTASEKGVRLWDTSDGALITTLERSRFPAHFSPDARRLVTGGTDKTAYLYELPAR